MQLGGGNNHHHGRKWLDLNVGRTAKKKPRQGKGASSEFNLGKPSAEGRTVWIDYSRP
jgi:hypothetical protein